MITEGYKIYDKDWTNIFHQEVAPGVIFESMNDEKIYCFYENIIDCIDTVFSIKNKRIAKVVALGEVQEIKSSNHDSSTYWTNKLKIIEELDTSKLMAELNIGFNNIGYCNTGHNNKGNFNSGDFNNGNCNSGSTNNGNRNTGNYNWGDGNTCGFNQGADNTSVGNIGKRNTGIGNYGNSNTGYFCKGDKLTGFFNTSIPTRYFNQEVTPLEHAQATQVIGELYDYITEADDFSFDNVSIHTLAKLPHFNIKIFEQYCERLKQLVKKENIHE